jgi:hypothetical protein
MSQGIYAKNIAALRKTGQINLVESLEKTNVQNSDHCLVFEGVKEDIKVLKVKREGSDNYILYNSFYDPYKEAEDITSHIDYSVNRSLIVSIGVGMGYHLSEMLRKLNEKSVVLAIEHDGMILKTLLINVDFSEDIEEGKIYFSLISKDFKELTNLVENLFLNILSIQTVLLSILDMNYIQFSKKIVSYLGDLRSSLEFTLGNDLDDTIDGIVNRLYNLPQMIVNPGLKQFLDKYKDKYLNKPAIIISTGPSLDKNIHLLKEAKGKALLLACDASMNSLKRHNIIPDVVSSVERGFRTYEAFYKNEKMPDETVLVAPAVVRPEIFKRFSTKTLSVFKSEPIAEYFNEMVFEKGTVFSGISVAHQLMGIAHALGASPIILIGQDLAYSSDGVTHANATSIKEKIDVDKINLFVKGVDGSDVPTTFIWKQFKQIFEQYISQAELNCVDATEGGALIEGTTIMTLREAIDQYCLEEVPAFRSLVDSLEVDDSYIPMALKNSSRKIIRLSKKFYLLKLKCEKSVELNQLAQKRMTAGLNTDKELNQVYDALEYTEEKIVKYITRHPELTMFFQFPITQTVRRVNALGSVYTLENIQGNLEIHLELLQTIVLYSNKVMKAIEEGFDFIKNHSINIDENEIDYNFLEYPSFLKI